MYFCKWIHILFVLHKSYSACLGIRSWWSIEIFKNSFEMFNENSHALPQLFQRGPSVQDDAGWWNINVRSLFVRLPSGDSLSLNWSPKHRLTVLSKAQEKTSLKEVLRRLWTRRKFPIVHHHPRESRQSTSKQEGTSRWEVKHIKN